MEDFVDYRGERGLRGVRVMAAEGIEEARLAEFFAIVVEGFGDAVGVEGEDVAGAEVAFAELALPLFENADDGGGGFEARYGVVGAEEKRGEMAAVGVMQEARRVVIFGEEQRGVGAVGGVFAEELVHGAQEMIGLLVGDGGEAAQIGLQVGHQERGGDSFAGNVRDYEAETILTEIEEIVVVAADLAGLDADARVFESAEWR